MATRSAAGTCNQYERSSLRSCNRRLVTTCAISDTTRILPGPLHRAGLFADLRSPTTADGISARIRTRCIRRRAEIRTRARDSNACHHDRRAPSASSVRPIRVVGAAP